MSGGPATRPLRPSAARNGFGQLLLEFGKPQRCGLWLAHDRVPAGVAAQTRGIQNRFAAPAQPVANDGLADSLRDNDADFGYSVGRRRARGKPVDGKRRRRRNLSAPHHEGEFAPTTQTFVGAHQRGTALVRRQPRAALAPACSDDPTPRLRRHPGAKAVSALAAAVVRLVRALHWVWAPKYLGKLKACPAMHRI